jgi:homoserine O-acetyltransferase
VWRFLDMAARLPDGFRLESGESLSRPEIALRIYGDREKPLVIVAGGVSAGRVVADSGVEKGWWRDVVGPGRALSTAEYCIAGFDFLPNVDEAARTISTLDQARALGCALSKIGADAVHAFVGASYGGMIALAFAQEYPERLGKLCVISAAEKPHPAGTALRGVQRRIIEFAKRAGDPTEGVSLARQIAMTTYRTPEEFAARFDLAPGACAGAPYPVCEYLIARGRAYDMPAERYVTLSDSIDRHRVDPSRITARTLLVAVAGDRLTPLGDMERLSRRLALGSLQIIDSIYGHDAFLKDAAIVGPLIAAFVRDGSEGDRRGPRPPPEFARAGASALVKRELRP